MRSIPTPSVRMLLTPVAVAVVATACCTDEIYFEGECQPTSAEFSHTVQAGSVLTAVVGAEDSADETEPIVIRTWPNNTVEAIGLDRDGNQRYSFAIHYYQDDGAGFLLQTLRSGTTVSMWEVQTNEFDHRYRSGTIENSGTFDIGGGCGFWETDMGARVEELYVAEIVAAGFHEPAGPDVVHLDRSGHVADVSGEVTPFVAQILSSEIKDMVQANCDLTSPSGPHLPVWVPETPSGSTCTIGVYQGSGTAMVCRPDLTVPTLTAGILGHCVEESVTDDCVVPHPSI